MADLPYIPNYKIVRKLGEGGMAKVYLGIQETLDREVAIKILEPFLLKNKVIAERFEKEAKIAAMLSHTNIIQIFVTGRAGDYHYIVMEYLKESLKSLMERHPQGKVHLEIALDIVEAMMGALDYAHFKRVYHRDIKPDNIMFRSDSTPVLLDFGIARVLDSQLTKSGMSMGSADYMSPEQCKAQKVDGRSDIYSLGAVLFEMLTGEKPYKGDPVTVALQQIEKPVPRLPQDLSRYQPLIDKMMAKDKEKRLSSRKEFLQLLDKVLISPEDTTSQLVEESISQPMGPPPTLPKNALSSFKEFSSLKKLAFVVLPVIVLAALSLIIIRLAFNTSTYISESFVNPPVSSISNEELLTKDMQYYTVLNLAGDLYTKGGLENLKYAQELVNRLKEIKSTPELSQLEEKVAHRIELQAEFNKYFARARNYFNRKNPDKAKENISLAKKIKVTPELETLEKRIDKALYKLSADQKIKDRKLQQKDDQAYEDAKSQDTIEAYQKYLDGYPRGRHIEEAQQQLTALKRSKMKLRFQYRFMNDYAVELMIKRFDFFESKLNKDGASKNHHYERKIRSDNPVVIDNTTNLIWYDGKSPGDLRLDKAETWLENLNIEKYGGYDDWRFPTLEEAASLLRNKKNSKGLHIASAFSGDQQRIWTKDYFDPKNPLKRKKLWIVYCDSGTVKLSSKSEKHHVRPVRSLKERTSDK